LVDGDGKLLLQLLVGNCPSIEIEFSRKICDAQIIPRLTQSLVLRTKPDH
jgi:hypothetical protein